MPHTLTVRRQQVQTAITLPLFEDDEPIWYDWAHDVLHGGRTDMCGYKTVVEVLQHRIYIYRLDAQIVHIAVMEFESWLWSHELTEISRLPGMLSSTAAALECCEATVTTGDHDHDAQKYNV